MINCSMCSHKLYIKTIIVAFVVFVIVCTFVIFNEKPNISVIVPVYNAKNTIIDTMGSIFAQTYKNFEIICVNDGSTDVSLKILQDMQKKHRNMRIYSQANGGLSVARNSGINLARGKYIYFIDSDDIIHYDTLKLLYKTIKVHNVDFVSCRHQMMNLENAKSLQDRPLGKIDYRIIIDPLKNTSHINGSALAANCWTKLYKKSLIGETRFKPRMFFEDIFFNINIFSKAKRCAILNAILYSYIFHDNSMVQSALTLKKAKDVFFILEYLHAVYGHDENIMHNFKTKIYPSLTKVITWMFEDKYVAEDIVRVFCQEKIKDFLYRGIVNFEDLKNQNLLQYIVN